MIESQTSYHGQPVLKEPIWTWEIPCYFYTGGLGGGSAALAWLAGWRGNETLARRAWAVAATGITISPALLTSDLGRPARFLNMLRMFKVTSPMSVGSWLLVGAGATTTVSAVGAWSGRLQRTARLAQPAAALLGLPLSTYTAALLANTADSGMAPVAAAAAVRVRLRCRAQRRRRGGDGHAPGGSTSSPAGCPAGRGARAGSQRANGETAGRHR